MSRRTSLVVLQVTSALIVSGGAQALTLDGMEKAQARLAPPVLEVSPARIDLTVTRPETGTSRIVVRNAGGRSLRWSVAGAPEWLSFDVGSGELALEEKRRVSLTVSAAGLEPGQARRSFKVEAPGAKGSPFTILIVLDVKPAAEAKPETPSVKPEGEAADEKTAAGEPPAQPGKTEAAATPPPAEESAAGKKHAFGVRAGVFMPGGGYRAGPSVGLFWRPNGGARLGYEVAVNLGRTESDTGYEESILVGGHAAALLKLARTQRSDIYALGGVGFLSETREDVDLGTSTGRGMAIDLGAGVAFRGGLDARVTYSILMGSEGSGLAAATVGYVF